MANVFKDISQFTLKSAATGTEEFQVSATEKVTAQQIANKVQLSQVIMSGFSALNFTGIEKIKDDNSLLGALAILYDLLGKGNIKMVSNGSTEYGFVSMGDVSGTTHGFGWLLSISEKAIYIKNDFTSPNPSTLNNIQWVNTIKTGGKVSLDDGIPIIEVGDFTMINEVWPAKQVPGSMCAFYTGSDVYSQPEATEVKYVGFIILDSDFSTNKQATVVAFAKTSGKQYIGRLEFESQEINWFTNINTPVTVTDFKSLPNSVKNAKDGEIIPIIAPASASNGPTGLTSTGPAYGYVQVAKTGSTKAYNFLVQMDSAGNGPRMYTGFVNTAANLIYWLPLNSEESSTIAPVSITEYGDIYGTTAIGENPAGTIVPWYAQGTNVDGDMGPFGGEASRVDGIYITVEGDNGSNNGRSGYLVAYGADHEGMAYCQVSGTTDNGGGVANTSDWVVLKPSSDIDLNCPIPGYTKVNGGTIDCSLTNGSTTVVSLTKDIPNNSICFIEADVLDKVTGGSIKTSAPLMFFRYASGATMCDINSKALAGSNISAQVKLNVATITGNSSFVVVSTCYNLDSSISSGVCRIKNIYALI